MIIEIFPRRRLLRRTQWHWRTRDSDNKLKMGRSSEGYNNRGECAAAVAKHQREMPVAEVREVDR